MAEYDPDWIVLQVASIDPDPKILEKVMLELLRLVHTREAELRIGASEFSFGWHFYQIWVATSTLRKLAQLSESGLVVIKGDSIEQKFVNWLNRQAKSNGINGIDEKMHFTLMSDLKSSRYGFF